MAIMILAVPVLAAGFSYGPPTEVCLNKYTIPYIHTDRLAIEIVDEAYDKCQDVLAQWDKEKKSLPPKLVVSKDEEFHVFYVHMIEARRKSNTNKKMTIVFIPALVAVLLSEERKIGRELTQQEVESIRDSATAVQVPVDVAKEMIKERGYLNIDPENAWEEWLLYKKYVN